MCSGRGTRALPRAGFPIRKSRDQRLVSTSPGLIAAAHVLHRLSAPRHPPCALILLIRKNTLMPLWSFQGAHGHAPVQLEDRLPGLSKLNSVVEPEVDVVLGDSKCPDERPASRPTSTGSRAPGVKSSGFPRKEVIQPHLPVRLPCYDFTPIIDPTFDGCLPCGLAHRLRVLPTFVV
jgi:hypothetical protein